MTAAPVALVALGELGRDEFRRRSLHDVVVEALVQLIEQRPVARQEPRLQQRRADRHVGARLADALVDRARRVPDLEPEIPQRIEHRLGDALAPGGLLVGKEKQKIDVGAGRQHPASVAADGHDRHALARRWIAGTIKRAAREFERDLDDRIHQTREALGAGAARALDEQKLFGALAPFRERPLQALREFDAQIRFAPAIGFGERFDLGAECLGVDEVHLGGTGPA